MGKNKRNKRQDIDLGLPDSDNSDDGDVAPAAPVSRFGALPTGDTSSDEAPAPAPVAPKKKGGKKKGAVNAFALLGGDDEDESSISEKVEEMKIEPVEAAVVDPFAEEDSGEEDKRKKKKGGKKAAPSPAAAADGGGETGGTVKTKAQKAAEKKEKERKKREQAKAKKTAEDDEFAAALADAGVVVADDYVEEKKSKKKKKKKVAEVEDPGEKPATETPPPTTEDAAKPAAAEEKGGEPAVQPGEEGGGEGGEEEAGGKKKKKKKKKGAAAEPAEKKPSAMGRLLKERQELIKKQEEEFLRQQEEAEREAERKEEERLEKLRIEEERKQRKKEKEKERKERKKKEGTWLTKAEKERRERDQAALEAMRAQGIKVPDKDGEKKPAGKVRYGARQRKKKPQPQEEQIIEAMNDKSPSAAAVAVVPSTPEDLTAETWELLDTPKVVEPSSVADNWDESEEESGVAEKEDEAPMSDPVLVDEDGEIEEEEDEDESESESEEEEDEDDSEEEESESDEEDLPVRERLEVRKEKADKNKDPNVLRAPILCVLGHVDTGKTTILDKLRKTNVQEGEAGGITQQIGATNVPIANIIRECSHLTMPELKIPGMLIIDTPGHESFSNLRSRGSSLCDMAILVVDIMHGLEQQTIESINLLKKRRTPFIIALNKIDRLYEWKIMNKTPVEEAIKKQKKITRDEFSDRANQALLQIAEQGLNAKLFYENPDVRTYISVVPVSGISGDGMADLLCLACELSQRMLGPQLIYKDVLEAMVLEVKAIHGLGTTVDIILKNGQVKEGDTVILSGIEGAFSTTVRAVLTPHPMKEMRVKNNFVQHKVVQAAQGIKICAKETDKTLAGMPVYIAKYPDECEVLIEDANKALKQELKSIKVGNEGVYVQASTLGSLEALLQFLKDSKIKYSGVSIGPVHKKDVMKASVMLEHDKEFACLLAFDVKVEREAQEMADSLGVRIFTADIIYHLFDQFMGYKEELKQRRKEENKHSAVFPCRLRVLPTCIFNTRDPIVLGVTVINGVLRTGTPLCVPSKDFCHIGVCTSLEINNKQIEVAHTGQDVCIKVENIGTGEAPKLYGRHFDENDVIVSKITRDSIDTLKEYFRDDMTKENWKLIVELKKIFEIM